MASVFRIFQLSLVLTALVVCLHSTQSQADRASLGDVSRPIRNNYIRDLCRPYLIFKVLIGQSESHTQKNSIK